MRTSVRTPFYFDFVATGGGVASSRTPLPSVRVAQKKTWPLSFTIAPFCTSRFVTVEMVPNPGMTVPVPAKRCSKRSEKT